MNSKASTRDYNPPPLTALRVLILGASGLLGKYLVREWSLPGCVLGLSSRDVDIRNSAQTRTAVQEHKPDWIILAAAYTDVDGCETNSELAMNTNFNGALNVAGAANENHSRLLFVSSDYVFDGSKTTPYEIDDLVNPQSIYGRSKAEAECGIREILPSCCIVRTSWVFGTGGRCFPETILKLAETRNEIAVVNDQRGCPTYARDLARAIVQLCARNAVGTVHATNAGNCTWFEFASEMIRQSGLPTVVVPTTTDKFPRPAQRPKYSVLSATSLRACGVLMPTWQEGVQAYLHERTQRHQFD